MGRQDHVSFLLRASQRNFAVFYQLGKVPEEEIDQNAGDWCPWSIPVVLGIIHLLLDGINGTYTRGPNAHFLDGAVLQWNLILEYLCQLRRVFEYSQMVENLWNLGERVSHLGRTILSVRRTR